MLRLILGLAKGAVVGGALGYGAYHLGLDGGVLWLVYGLVGLLVGFLCGRPVWSYLRDRSSTVWTAILKGLFGLGIGCGLYAVASKVWSGPAMAILGETRPLLGFQFVLGGAIGALYGAFVELDDGGPAARPAAKKPATRS